MRRAHRALAVLLALFLALHLGNHLAGLGGQAVHGAVQASLRTIYRHSLVEPLLLAAVGAQLALGIGLVLRRMRWTLQTISGGYLALFLLIHLAAILGARWQGTETDLAFAAAGLHARPPGLPSLPPTTGLPCWQSSPTSPSPSRAFRSALAAPRWPWAPPFPQRSSHSLPVS